MLTYIPFTNSSKSADSGAVICLGNFDGVHIGHARLIEETIAMKQNCSDQNVRACAMCFSPFPSDYFSNIPVRHIMSMDKKLDIFRSMGLDGVYICDFDRIHALSPDEFIDSVLLKGCNCIGVVCGFNYRFGRGAAGTPEDLKNKFSDFSCGGFKMVEPVKLRGVTVSSSLVKSTLESGDILLANEMLGRPFSISHKVVHGKKLGTKLGFPTINYVFKSSDMIPGFGIYVTMTEVGGMRYESVTNVGVRPTIDDGESVTCETHIINSGEDCDLYDQYANVYFLSKIRNEKRFGSIEELSEAISSDVKFAKSFFDQNKEWKHCDL